jgi:hypothetical protein
MLGILRIARPATLVHPDPYASGTGRVGGWIVDTNPTHDCRAVPDPRGLLVLDAYGWTDTPTDEQILERLVALNKQRALEEKVGNVKWLRPDYQIPRFGSEAERARLASERAAEKAKAKQSALDLDADDDDEDAAAPKPRFPTGKELEETAAVMSILAAAPSAIGISGIATRFAQGRQIEKRVGLTILALARLGQLSSSDNGQTFALRRVG